MPSKQDFADIVRSISKKCPKISGDDIAGMLQDVWHFFEEAPEFSQIDVRRTEAGEELIEVRCRCSASEPDSARIAWKLETIWLDNLRYLSGEEAHIIVQTDEAVTLKAITVSGLGDYYVTLKVNVSLGRATGQYLK